MNTSFQFLDASSCSCGHHMILAPGNVCDVCMGIVPEPKAVKNEDWYGADYFDALEVELGKGSMAA